RGVCWFWSMFTLTTRSLPSYCWASASSIGAMALHGPHHSAQKSSSTGVSDFSTSCSKASSLTWVIRSLTGKSPWLGAQELRGNTQWGGRRRNTRIGVIGYTQAPMKHGLGGKKAGHGGLSFIPAQLRARFKGGLPSRRQTASKYGVARRLGGRKPASEAKRI